MSKITVVHSRMKHLVIDYHFFRDMVQLSELHVIHVLVGDQLVNALTKSLSRSHLFYLCNKFVLFLAHHLEGAY